MISTRRFKWLTLAYTVALASIIAAADSGALSVAFLLRLPGADKLGHFLIMGGLSFLANVSLGVLGWRRFTVPRGCLALSLLVGLEELSQVWLRHRAFELADLAADIAGILVFGALASAALRAEDCRASSAAGSSACPPADAVSESDGNASPWAG